MEKDDAFSSLENMIDDMKKSSKRKTILLKKVWALEHVSGETAEQRIAEADKLIEWLDKE